jgi:hypothetical protein
MWNDLIKIRDKYTKRLEDGNPESKRYKTNLEVRNAADRLLRQLNTAGGTELMKNEIEIFIDKFGGLIK